MHDRLLSAPPVARRALLASLLILVIVGCKKNGDGDPVAPAEPATTSDQAPAVPAPPTPEAGDDAASAAERPVEEDLGPVSTALGAPPPALAGRVRLEQVVTGLSRPVGLEHPGDGSGRLFVVEQVGRIRILRDGKLVARPFYDIVGKVSRANEQGLLSLAFHPRFADNRKLYVNYTDREGTTRVVEYRVAGDDPDRVDMASAREIFALEQPYSNHNGGGLEFGPDGKLYIGTGDGGAANDPLGAGQDRDTLLAKMLRIDVDAAAPKPEIVAIGLRNPWRYAFDPATGDLYIADVGQNKWEFIYVVGGENIDGHNFGWNVVEGNHCFRPRKDCDKSGFTPAVIEYDHATGCSITGGHVYRGKAIEGLAGHYFYADFCTGLLRSFRWSEAGVHQHWDWKPVLDPRGKVSQISSFGVDAAGELYVISLGGTIWKLISTAA